MYARASPRSHRKEQAPSRAAAAPDADQSASSRRRKMAFLKYGSERKSATSMHRSREQIRQIAKTLGDDMPTPTSTSTFVSSFADFSNAFGNEPSSSTKPVGAFVPQDPFPEQPRRSADLFGGDPFSPGAQKAWAEAQLQNQLSPTGSMRADAVKARVAEAFKPVWPQGAQSMTTLPANSSMQASYAQRTASTPRQHLVQTPEPSPTSATSSPIPSYSTGSVSGAAARRRMRNQMRSLKGNRSDTDSAASQTPPQSPYSMKRHNSIDSVGSGSRTKPPDHVANYAINQRAQISANRSVSTKSSSNSSSEVNLFDPSTVNGGFTFDAFGLDASQINREVNEAMHDIAGTNPDLSFFLDQDPTDDFAAGRWDSPAGSRSSTPVYSEEDGFVDGFRVAKMSMLPQHIRNSPSSTERSSLTSESSGRLNIVDGGVNMFKQKAGFHESRPRRVVRPDEAPDFSSKALQVPSEAPQLPVLEDESVVRPRSHRPQDVDFFDADFSDFSAAPSSMAGVQFATSAIAAPSDTGVSTQFARSDQPAKVLSDPKQDKERRSLTPPPADERSFQSQEEKKDEDAEGKQKPNVSNLKAKWDKGGGVVKADPTPVKSTNVQPDTKAEFARRQADASFRAQTAKSEGGAAVGASQVNKMLQRLDSSSPRDSRSDVGTSPVLSAFKRPSGFERTHDYAGPLNSSTARRGEDVSDISRPAPYIERRDHAQRLEEERVSQISAKPMTYRERRELELQRHREEEQLGTAQESGAPSQPDVASQIRRRIAQHKEGFGDTGRTQHSPLANTIQSTSPPRARQLSDTDDRQNMSQVQRMLASSSQTNSRLSLSASPELKTDLVIRNSPRTLPEKPPTPINDVPVSRLQMLQQIQTSFPVESTMSPHARAKSTVSSNGSIEDEQNERLSKTTTPKATMMMLNAFLAGRESISSTDGASASARSALSQMDQPHDVDLAGSQDDGNGSPRAGYKLPALKDDPKYERYFKMLKIGMPMGVVKHAMTRDGLDASVMDGDHNKPVGVPLKFDPTYTKYFKMFKIGLPMEAVKHAMERDGLDSTVMDQDHDLPVQRKRPESGEDEPKEHDSHRRARLHWKPLRKVTSNSLWAKIDQDEALENIEIDEEEFQELFQLEKSADNGMRAMAAVNAGPKRGAVRVIDPKRANNGGIILARLKMSHDDMADAVDRINENALSTEQIENIIEYLPTKEERKCLEAYMLEGGQDAAEKFEGLCECEKFMVSMMTVKHAKRKVRALLFKLQFQTCLEDIHNDTVAVEAACDELCNSVRLRQLLGIILTFGNRLNTAGNSKRKAGAFTLDSLLKLNQAKAFDKKTTFLHYIVLIVQRNNELLLRFKDDLPTVFKADKIYWDQCVADLEEVENQLENVRKIALYQARHSMAYRLRRKKREEDEESFSDGEVSLTLEEEVEALRATPIGLFTLSAIKYVSSLRDRVEETKSKYARLVEYFGVDDGSMQPHELFNIIGTFSRDFDKAKEQVFENEKKKNREERKRQASKGKTPTRKIHDGRPPTHSPAHAERSVTDVGMMKVSNLQPSMSLVLKELKGRSDQRSEGGSPIAIKLLPRPNQTSAPQGTAKPAPPERFTPVNGPRNHLFTQIQPSKSALLRSIDELSSFESPSPSERSPVSTRSPQKSDTVVAGPPSSSSRSPNTPASSTKAMMLQKARMRAQRHSIDRSPPSTASRSKLNENNADSQPPGQNGLHSSTVYGRPISDDDDGAQQPLSPRTAMRQRMEQHRLRAGGQ